MKRSNSAIELLRIFLLAFLIAAHWTLLWNPSEYIDTKIIGELVKISVPIFALITGMFVFRKKSLVFRNISRILFIILISSIIGGILLACNVINFDVSGIDIFKGSRDIWYIYMILPTYILGPLLSKKIAKFPISITIMIGFVLAMIGFSGGYIKTYTNTSLEFSTMEQLGIIFSPIMLFGMAILGNSISKINNLPNRKNMYRVIYFSLAIVSNFTTIFISIEIENGSVLASPIYILSCFSILLFFSSINWYSEKINWLAKRLYFVYEFHWYWQYLWISIFSTFIMEYPHIQLYINWITIFIFGSVVSILVTQIQIHIWNRYVDPLMIKIINKIKSVIKN